MELGDIVKPFTISYKGQIYKVTYDRKEYDSNGLDHFFLNVENVDTGDIQNIQIKNYDKGSGNEHLIGTLEYEASKGYTDASYEALMEFLLKNGLMAKDIPHPGGRHV